MIGSSTQSTVAILVLYNAHSGAEDAELSLKSRLESLANLGLGHLLVVDNDEHPQETVWAKVLSSLPHWRGQLLFNHNRGGLAGAYNRALEALQAIEPPQGLAWTSVVLLDQDSDTQPLMKFLDDATVAAALDDSNVAAVAPAHRERRTGLRGQPMRLSRWTWTLLPRECSGMVEVSFLINSMTVWRRDALRVLGPFNEGLAVDHIDTDMCLRARREELKLLLCGHHEFLHEIGQRRSYRLGRWRLQATGHGPGRRSQLARNTVVLALRYGWRLPSFAALCVARLAYEVVGICLAENAKLPKLAALLAGTVAGVWAAAVRR